MNSLRKTHVKDPEKKIFERLKALIEGHQRFLITTHVLPDGDGLGGEIALAEHLKTLGKEVSIVNSDPTPEKFGLVDPDFEIHIWDPKKPLPQVDLVFAIDVNDRPRLGPLNKALELLKAKVVFIDHHISDETMKHEHVIDEDISSMGEMLHRYFEVVDAEVTFKMALAMYVSIFTDTNAFRHRKTTALSHKICASLVEVGVDPNEVFRRVHQTRSINQMHLLGEVLKNVKTRCQGKIAWVEIPQSLQQKYEATAEDTQAFVDYLLILKEVEVGLLFREEENGKIKISFRSKGKVEIFPLVQKLGGGGHAFEAGVACEGKMQDVVQSVLEAVSKIIP